MGSKEVVEAICKGALLENSLTYKTGTGVIQDVLDEMKRGGFKTKPILFPGTSYHVVDLTDKPVNPDTFQAFDPNVRATFGKFMLTFLNKNDRRVRRGRHFVLDQDLIRARIFFYNWGELMFIAERVPEVAWIVRNSTLTPELLELACQHVGVPFVFTIDWVRYAKKLREIEKDLKAPYVTYLTTKEACDKYKDKLLSDRRNINDYTADIAGLYDNNPEDYKDEEK